MEDIAKKAFWPLLALVLTVAMQKWIGNVTIYREEIAAKRQMMHEAIVKNEPPEGKPWSSIGANGVNIRIASVFLVEGAHRVTGVSAQKLHQYLDTLCLFLAFLLVPIFLRRWFEPVWCLTGMLYVAAVMPLTYFLHWFHPWDRLGLVAWIGMFFAVRDRRPWLFGALLVASVTIKYDCILLPGLWWLAYLRKEDWQKTTVIAGVFFAAAVGTYMALKVLRPGGFDAPDAGLFEQIGAQMSKNVGKLTEQGPAFPPFLAMVVPVLAAPFGLRAADRFTRAAALFGLLLFIPWALLSNIDEFRAHVPSLVLLLPLALLGTQRLLADQAGQSTPKNSNTARTTSS